MRVSFDDRLADGRPEMTARALFAERQGAEMSARGDRSQHRLARRKRPRRGDHLRGADVHQVDHRRRGAVFGQGARDRQRTSALPRRPRRPSPAPSARASPTRPAPPRSRPASVPGDPRRRHAEPAPSGANSSARPTHLFSALATNFPLSSSRHGTSATSPKARVPKARNTGSGILSLMKRTEPSVMANCTPPGCALVKA